MTTALEWIFDNAPPGEKAVVNISFFMSNIETELHEAMQQLINRNIPVVIAAGNADLNVPKWIGDTRYFFVSCFFI